MQNNTLFFNTLFYLTLFAFCPPLIAQVSQDFESGTGGTNLYIDGGSSTVEHELVNNPLPQSQPNATDNGNLLGYQVTFTPTRTGSSNSGLTDGDLFGLIDFTVPASADNNMGDLNVNYIDDSPPPSGGSKIYNLEDPDGLTTIRFSPVDLSGTNTPMFTMDYLIHSTGYENSDGADDRVKIYLEINDGASEIVLLEAANDGIPDTETWVTLTQDLTAQVGNTVRLIIEFDANSSSEEMAIDNIQFSEGEIDDTMVCNDADVPVLSQNPAMVCTGLPYSLEITGSLNAATDWFIYSDAAATNLVASTNANVLYFANAQAGTSYYVRSEGGCTMPGQLIQIDIQLSDPANCTPGTMPGTSFEEPLGFINNYVDLGDPSTVHILENNQAEPTVNFPFTATELGFTCTFTPSRTGASNVGLTDGDLFGVTNENTFNFPDGEQGLAIEDTDGRVEIVFSTIDMTGVANPTLSFQYFVNSATYEASNGSVDMARVYLMVDNGAQPDIELIAGTGDGNNGLDGLTTGAWTLIETTPGFIPTDAQITLVIEADFDASVERILFDDILFSGGTIVTDDCTNDTTPPVLVCIDDIEANIDPGFCDAELQIDLDAVEVTDNCATEFILSSDAPQIFPIGTTTVNVITTDGTNTGTCTFNVTIIDTLAPTLIPPVNTTLEHNTDSCTYVIENAALDVNLSTIRCAEPMSQINDFNQMPSLNGAELPLGTTSVLWTFTLENGLSNSLTVDYTIEDTDNSCISNLSEADLASLDIQVYPNPATDLATITFRATDIIARELEIRDLSGRAISQYTLTPSPDGWYNQRLNIQHIPTGVYLLQVTTDRGVFTRKLNILH